MERKVIVSTDCVCDLTKEIIEKYEIPVMHYYVLMEQGRRFRDIEEVYSENLIEYMTEGHMAHSSAAPVEEYREFFSKLAAYKKPIVHLCMAGGVSSGYERAAEAAKDFNNIYVIDSKQLSAGLGLLVICAAEMAQQGSEVEKILQMLDLQKEQIVTSFIADTVEYLYKGGRVSKRIYSICKTFLIKPVLILKNGNMGVGSVHIGKTWSCAKKYIKAILKDKKNIDTRMAFLITSGCSYEMQQMIYKEIEKYQSFEQIIHNDASATISSNCGPGAFGILFMCK